MDNIVDRVKNKLKEGISSREDYLEHIKRKYDDKWLNGTVIELYPTPYPEYPLYCKVKLESHHKVDLPFYVYGFVPQNSPDLTDLKKDKQVQVIMFFSENKMFIKNIRDL